MSEPAPPATRPAGRPTRRGARTRERIHHGLRELNQASGARAMTQRAAPTVVAQDDLAVELERRVAGPFVGIVYFVWMEHSADGACERDPITDPHEDLAYVGKTCRTLAVRMAEHFARTVRGEPNKSAVYRAVRRGVRITGWSQDSREYATPEDLEAAEYRAIRALWPALNIQDQDRRNPHTRATRKFRRPDRLAPLIGLASVLWGLLWTAITASLLAVGWTFHAPWWGILLCPLIAWTIVNGTLIRHLKITNRRRRRK